jgi:hypothetical protein
MSTTWMYSPTDGHFPCSDPAEIEAFKKAGWVECGPPPWKKIKEAVKDIGETIEEKAEEITEDVSDELTELKEKAHKLGVKLDKRWGVAKIKKALGLK